MASFDFSNGTFSQAVRVVTLNGQPWFVAADVCRALGMSVADGTHRYLRNLSDDEKSIISRDLTGNPAQISRGSPKTGSGLSVISESGLYKLILRSNKPEAKAFQDWVTRVVLPAIRKDGGYIVGEEKVATGELSEDELILRAVDILRTKVDRLTRGSGDQTLNTPKEV